VQLQRRHQLYLAGGVTEGAAGASSGSLLAGAASPSGWLLGTEGEGSVGERIGFAACPAGALGRTAVKALAAEGVTTLHNN
jgi:hypothetical protein